MEERIVDDEYARGIRLKKTDDGYVDATDELAEDGLVEDGEDDVYEMDGDEEITFDIPDLEEDDEDLVNLTPAQAQELRRQKAAALQARKDEYARLCKDGETLLASGSFKAAELKFEKALELDEEAADASYGYWRAKTADFSNCEELADEYAAAGISELESDLGYTAVQMIKENYAPVFKKMAAELEKKEKPLAEKVLAKQEERRVVLSARRKKSLIAFIVSMIPALVTLVLTVVFGAKIFSTPDGRYVTYTLIAAGVFVVALTVFLVFTNKFINTMRIFRANERLSSTEDGAELVRIRQRKELYLQLSK